jgi:L-threonylcarbamoyladenylate synthase
MSDNNIKKAAEILKKGGVVLIPTDTVYGLATSMQSEDGVKRIYEIKKRGFEKPLAVLIPSIDCLWNLVEKTANIEKICKKYWPGATTLVMDSKDGKSIGVRMPDYEPVIELMNITGPLYATSANISGESVEIMLEDIPEEIKVACDFILAGEGNLSGVPSKVIDVRGGEEKILRA